MTKLRAVITIEYEADPKDYTAVSAEGMALEDRAAAIDSPSEFIDNFDAGDVKIEVSVVEI